MASVEDLRFNNLTSSRMIYSNTNDNNHSDAKLIEKNMRFVELSPKFKRCSIQKLQNRNDFEYESSDEEIWLRESDLYMHHLNEIYEKYDIIDDDIWCKIICMERNKRVAKAYVRVPVVTINGSHEGFDGLRIGLGAFENCSRDSHVSSIKSQIAQGLKIKLDKDGSILAKRISKNRMVYIKGTNNAHINCFSDDIYYNDGLLEYEKPTKIFDMKIFKDKISMSIKQPSLIKYLQFMSIISISFVEDQLNPLNTPCWIMIINIAALDILKDMKLITPLAILSSPSHFTKQNITKEGNFNKLKAIRRSMPILEKSSNQAILIKGAHLHNTNEKNNVKNIGDKKLYNIHVDPENPEDDVSFYRRTEYRKKASMASCCENIANFNNCTKVDNNRQTINRNLNYKYLKDSRPFDEANNYKDESYLPNNVNQSFNIVENNDYEPNFIIHNKSCNLDDQRIKKTRSALSLNHEKLRNLSNIGRYYNEASDNILVLPASAYNASNKKDHERLIFEHDPECNNDSGNCDEPDFFSSSQDFSDKQIYHDHHVNFIRREKFNLDIPRDQNKISRGRCSKNCSELKSYNIAPPYSSFSSNSSSEISKTIDDSRPIRYKNAFLRMNKSDKDADIIRKEENLYNLYSNNKIVKIPSNQNCLHNKPTDEDYHCFYTKMQPSLMAKAEELRNDKYCSKNINHRYISRDYVKNNSLSSHSSTNEYPYSISPRSSLNLTEDYYDEFESKNNENLINNRKQIVYNSLKPSQSSSTSNNFGHNEKGQQRYRTPDKNIGHSLHYNNYFE